MAPVNVLLLGEFDTGGQGARIKDAFDRHTDWTVRSMVKTRQYMAYQPDLPFRAPLADELYQWADVIHVRNSFDEYDKRAAQFGPKPVVLHVHGSKYRGDPNRFIREAQERGATILCSTLDLYLIAPEVSVWLPAPYDVDALEALA